MKYKSLRLIGGAGTGKTTKLMEIIDKLIDSGIDIEHIGFASFTKAARLEAVDRVCQKHNIQRDRMLDNGYFRTVHAISHAEIRPVRLLTGSKQDQEWLEGLFGHDNHLDNRGGELGYDCGISDVGKILQAWGAYRLCLGYARQADIPMGGGIDWDKMISFPAWFSQLNTDIGSSYALDVIKKYETHRHLDDVDDFTSLVGRYAGIAYDPEGTPRERRPEGDIPLVDTWLFDEQQDTSPLLDIACRRLCEAPGLRYVYLAGDPFQSIYGWSGASSRCFMGWEVDQEHVMPKSYRCCPEIHYLGERILQDCPDYWDRGIAPADHDGFVEEKNYGIPSVVNVVDADEEWLVLARTVREASTLLTRLRDQWPDHHIGWATRESEALGREKRAALALATLRAGEMIDGEMLSDIAHAVPVKLGHFAKGTRKRLEDDHERETLGLFSLRTIEEDVYDPFQSADFVVTKPDYATTDTFLATIRSDQWTDGFGDKMAGELKKIEKGGLHIYDKPGVRVSTIHGAKGMGAENVAYLATTTRRIKDECENNPDAAAEEARVRYVAVTRAKSRLVIAHPPKGFRVDIPT